MSIGPGVFCPNGTLYIIKPGDSLFTLAPRFNTTVEAIMAANPGIVPTNLQLGQQICIPVAPVPGSCPGGFLYTIRAGDTFFSISQRYGIAVPALAAANPGVDPNNLQIGQQICVPAPAPVGCPGGSFPYTIQAGDTFFSLARRFNTTVVSIQGLNPSVNPNNLQIGQVICIPREI